MLRCAEERNNGCRRRQRTFVIRYTRDTRKMLLATVDEEERSWWSERGDGV